MTVVTGQDNLGWRPSVGPTSSPEDRCPLWGTELWFTAEPPALLAPELTGGSFRSLRQTEVNMTWKQFKDEMEKRGVQDTDEIKYIDIAGPVYLLCSCLRLTWWLQ